MKYPGKVISGTRPTANLVTASAIWLTQDEMQGMYAVAWPGATPPALYTFTDITIAPLISSGIYGPTGPSLAQLISASSSSGSLSWQSNTSNFTSSSGIISWKVPATASYSFEIWGARGGNGASNNYLGGYGARMKGTFSLTMGDIIKILIGQMGGADYGGGGGGTFVAYANNVPLIVAGGGNTASPWSSTQSHAPTTNNGLPGSSMSNGGTGGGGGGTSSFGTCDGGAGFFGDGVRNGYNPVPGPQAFINGGAGNVNGCSNSRGGFGGGSASDGCYYGQSGPGGGYSGGGAGSTSSGWGGAGGSYNVGTNQSNDAGSNGTATRSNNGQVIITKL